MGREPADTSGFRPVGAWAALLLGIAAIGFPAAAPAAAAAAPAAAAGVPDSCRASLHFDGEPYGLLARGIGCARAHRWAARYQRQGVRPAHWSCHGREPFTEEGGCQDRRSPAYFTYYAED